MDSLNDLQHYLGQMVLGWMGTVWFWFLALMGLGFVLELLGIRGGGDGGDIDFGDGDGGD